ncbi:hypothetical protein FB45DRAFT_933651 [Roridomyces roridus]|uniref:Uncharacterized protein n=1 Tax=Roridomyces roridus TaxID=1738132 RepID=A0AAD7BCE7_9AGAR|nr:hypothetical protein FB45DRAFT_933651 [Roridomyces roridus]
MRRPARLRKVSHPENAGWVFGGLQHGPRVPQSLDTDGNWSSAHCALGLPLGIERRPNAGQTAPNGRSTRWKDGRIARDDERSLLSCRYKVRCPTCYSSLSHPSPLSNTEPRVVVSLDGCGDDSESKMTGIGKRGGGDLAGVKDGLCRLKEHVGGLGMGL